MLENIRIPRDIIVTENIPHNSMGKVDRKKLVSEYENRMNPENDVLQAILSRRSVRDFTEKQCRRK